MAELAERLAASLGSAYKVERELGGGGMSRVFLVRDETLGRQITVKVLSPELAEGVNSERFAREIRIVANLQHPHVIPVLSTGDLDGLPYYTMPYVSGQSARALLLRDGRIPIRRVVEILRDVAKALVLAHQNGIVHRDIKPDNILLTQNAAAVCDFGIAKAVSAARTPSQAPALTGMGVSIGTPAYMAPEQALGGDSVDHRADVYAFGATAYELLTGEVPFPNRPAALMIHAHISEQPAPVEAGRPDIPVSLAQLVMRCLAKDPGARPSSAAELLTALEGVGSHSQPLSTRRRWIIASATAGAVIAALLVWMTRSAATEAGSLAVLPFRSYGGDSTSEYFSDGMTEQLVSDLSGANGLRVAPRAVTFAQKGKSDSPRDLAAAMNVDLLVTGSVRRNGQHLRVEAELMDPRASKRLWGATYERQLDDVFLVQEEIARSIASALKKSLTVSRATAQMTDGHTYDLYLRGQHLMRFARRRSALDSAITFFEDAIARDSTFAPAWAGLSDAYRQAAEHVPPMTVLPRAKEAARQAVKLDPTDLNAGIALANITFNFDWNWDAAEREYRRILALHPDEPEALVALASFLAPSRRTDEATALVALALARELERSTDTLRARIDYARRLAWYNRMAGRFAEAGLALAELRRLDPASLPTLHAHAWTYLNWFPDSAMIAIESARPMFGGRLPYLSHLGVIYGRAGRRDTTRRVIRDLLRRSETEYIPKDQLFSLYVAVGDRRTAYQWLRRAVDERHWWLPYLNSHPITEPVRHDPEYQRFLARIGVPPAAR